MPDRCCGGAGIRYWADEFWICCDWQVSILEVVWRPVWHDLIFVVWLPGKVSFRCDITWLPLAFVLKDPIVNIIIKLLNKTSKISSFFHCLIHYSVISILLGIFWYYWCMLIPFTFYFLHVKTWKLCSSNTQVLLSVTHRCLQNICLDCINVLGRKEIKISLEFSLTFLYLNDCHTDTTVLKSDKKRFVSSSVPVIRLFWLKMLPSPLWKENRLGKGVLG